MKLLQITIQYLYGLFVGGLVVLKFYEWFAEPVFLTLPHITYFQAIGLSSFLYLFNQLKSTDFYEVKKKQEDDLVKYSKYILPWIILTTGFLTHLIIK